MSHPTSVLFAVIALGLIGCRSGAPSRAVIAGAEVAPPRVEQPLAVQVGDEASFKGIYTGAFEMSRFVPCGSDEQWWLEWRGVDDPGDGKYLVVIRAKVTGVGRYGHLGQYHRQAEVTHVEIMSGESPSCG